MPDRIIRFICSRNSIERVGTCQKVYIPIDVRSVVWQIGRHCVSSYAKTHPWRVQGSPGSPLRPPGASVAKWQRRSMKRSLRLSRSGFGFLRSMAAKNRSCPHRFCVWPGVPRSDVNTVSNLHPYINQFAAHRFCVSGLPSEATFFDMYIPARVVVSRAPISSSVAMISFYCSQLMHLLCFPCGIGLL